jgi:hypothetical protein
LVECSEFLELSDGPAVVVPVGIVVS